VLCWPCNLIKELGASALPLHDESSKGQPGRSNNDVPCWVAGCSGCLPVPTATQKARQPGGAALLVGEQRCRGEHPPSHQREVSCSERAAADALKSRRVTDVRVAAALDLSR